MTRRLVIITEIISPYRIPLFNALARCEDVSLHVIFLAETDPALRQWQVYKQEIAFSYQVLPSWRRRIGPWNVLFNRGISGALNGATPNAILCGGYNYIASWQALLWAHAQQVPFLLWSESNQQDLREGNPLLEFFKIEFLHRCRAFVVPGRSAREYLRGHRVPDQHIYTAPNAVDNELFAAGAARARARATECRGQLALPDRYFLFVGRLVREKGVFELLAAYAKLDRSLRQQIGLVYAGDGPCRGQLEAQAKSIAGGMVRFPGFVQRDQLAVYYALADALILPTYTDTWGLVVNEAMACGLPVIVSEVAGCAADLVRQDWNGLLVPVADASGLGDAMQKLGSSQELCQRMGEHSQEQILEYSPEAWAVGLRQALAGVVRGA